MPETTTTDPSAWKSGLPEELQTAPALKDVKDVATLAKRFVDTQAFVGSSIRPPGPDASAEQRAEFIAKLRDKAPELVLIPDGDDEASKLARDTAWQRLGRPKEAKDYAPPPDVELADEQLAALRTEALEEGLTKSQFAARAKRLAEASVTAAHARKEATASLKKELGAAFDERTAAAAALASKLGFPAPLVAALKEGTVDLSTFKAFSLVAKGFGETRNVADQNGGPGSGKLTPVEARAQREEIMSRSVYFNPKPNELALHRSLVAKVQELNELIGAGG
jgi:hypothetical protein